MRFTSHATANLICGQGQDVPFTIPTICRCICSFCFLSFAEPRRCRESAVAGARAHNLVLSGPCFGSKDPPLPCTGLAPTSWACFKLGFKLQASPQTPFKPLRSSAAFWPEVPEAPYSNTNRIAKGHATDNLSRRRRRLLGAGGSCHNPPRNDISKLLCICACYAASAPRNPHPNKPSAPSPLYKECSTTFHPLKEQLCNHVLFIHSFQSFTFESIIMAPSASYQSLKASLDSPLLGKSGELS